MIALFLAAAIFAPPDANELIRAALAARKAQNEHGWKFTYKEDYLQTDFDKNGKVEGKKLKTFDVIMLEGDNYRKLILIDGQPLDEKTQKKVDQDLEKARAERHKHSTLRTLVRSWSVAGLEDLEGLFDNRVVGEETVRDRKAWRVESEPKKDHKPANKQEEQIMGARRTTWFDEAEGIELKSDIEYLRPVEGMQPGSHDITEFTKIGDAWLVDTIVMKVDFKALGLIHARGESRYHYYDYKRFEVESKITVQ